MTDIASTLSYAKFDEVKDCKTNFDMWNKLKEIYGGYKNVRRAKEKILRAQFWPNENERKWKDCKICGKNQG